jgi:hypothetical protein
MTIHEGSDLLKKVERYEAALDDLRSAHGDVRDVLLDQIVYERWRQLGEELGFTAEPLKLDDLPRREAGPINQHIPEMSDAWAN